MSTLDVVEVDDADRAIVALWKATACLFEEWAYEIWSEGDASKAMHGVYEAEHQGWQELGKTRIGQFVDMLKARSAKVIDACDATEEANAKVLVSSGISRESGMREAESLSSVGADSLEVILRDEWNDLSALFRSDQRWHLVNWWTSA